MNFKLKATLLVLVILSTGTTSTIAETTGWINAYEAKRLGRSTERYNFVPTKIQCKNGESDKGNFLKNMSLKIDYRAQNKDKPVDWVAAYHTAMKQFEIRYAKQGFKLVSRDSYRRATGLKVECALWHRDRKK